VSARNHLLKDSVCKKLILMKATESRIIWIAGKPFGILLTFGDHGSRENLYEIYALKSLDSVLPRHTKAQILSWISL